MFLKTPRLFIPLFKFARLFNSLRLSCKRYAPRRSVQFNRLAFPASRAIGSSRLCHPLIFHTRSCNRSRRYFIRFSTKSQTTCRPFWYGLSAKVCASFTASTQCFRAKNLVWSRPCDLCTSSNAFSTSPGS